MSITSNITPQHVNRSERAQSSEQDLLTVEQDCKEASEVRYSAAPIAGSTLKTLYIYPTLFRVFLLSAKIIFHRFPLDKTYQMVCKYCLLD